MNEGLLGQAAKKNDMVLTAWTAYNTQRDGDPVWESTDEHAKIVEFLRHMLERMEPATPILVDEATKEFNNIRQAKGSMESVHFFQSFRQAADTLKVLTQKYGRVSPAVRDEPALIATCLTRLDAEVYAYVQQTCTEKWTISKDSDYMGGVPPTMMVLEQLVGGFANSKARMHMLEAAGGAKKGGREREREREREGKESKAKEIKSLERQLAKMEKKLEKAELAAVDSGGGGGGRQGDRGRGGGGGGGGGQRKTLVPHDVMPDVFAKGEGEFPPMLDCSRHRGMWCTTRRRWISRSRSGTSST